MRLVLLLGLAGFCLSGQTGNLDLVVEDVAGLRVAAQGFVKPLPNGGAIAFRTGPSGRVSLESLAAGEYELNVSAAGFEALSRRIQIASGGRLEEIARLEPVLLRTTLVVQVLPSQLDGVPGSIAVLSREEIDQLRPISIKEALRRISGIHIVDEDAFGLNLNIGMRGLNPRRTQRTLLLEDGMPVHLAPYSDPSAHYHTPPEAVDSIEVVKGSGQILNGPQTVGGLINFVTEAPPDRFRGGFTVNLGNRDFRGVQGKIGTGGERGGLLANLLYREGDGVRENHGHQIFRAGLSGLRKIGTRQTVQLKGSYYEENSRISEAGMSTADYLRNPLGNPFRNDRFELDRLALQGIHSANFNENLRLTTNAYYQRVNRTSYRQIDFAGDEMTSVAANGCTGAARTNYEEFASRCGNKMRPREYEFFGFEPRLEVRGKFLGMATETNLGIRGHREDISRRRFNGFTPDAREDAPGVFFRDWNRIRAEAVSTYGQMRLTAGRWALTPGLRLERVKSRNLVLRRGNVERNSELTATQTMVLPGLGITFMGVPRSSVYAGVHRGFAPARPDENFDPLDPNLIPVQAERSTNLEAGIRSYPTNTLQVEATVFQIRFTNQIVPGVSIGLPRQTWANGGRTVNTGFELNGRWDLPRVLPAGHRLFLSGAYTSVVQAEVRSAVNVAGVNTLGNRLAYAPRHLLSPAINYQHRNGINWNLSVEHVSDQFADDLNTRLPSANGSIGLIPGYTVVNTALNVPLGQRGPVLFFNLGNASDRRYIVSRVDGIHVGRPRQAMGGIRYQF